MSETREHEGKPFRRLSPGEFILTGDLLQMPDDTLILSACRSEERCIAPMAERVYWRGLAFAAAAEWLDNIVRIEGGILAQFGGIHTAVARKLPTGCGLVVDLQGDQDAVDLVDVHVWAKAFVVPAGIDLLVQWDAFDDGPCPYPDSHHASCRCGGMAGDR